MRLSPVLAIVVRQAYLMRGSPARILPMFAWVAIDIVLWGFITRYLNSVSGSGIDFVSTLLGAMLVPFVLVLFLFGIALGILASALVLRMGPASEWLVWPMPALLSPFVGVFYPLSTLPTWMQGVGLVLPPSYVFEGMRQIVLHQQFSAQPLLVGLVLATLQIFL